MVDQSAPKPIALIAPLFFQCARRSRSVCEARLGSHRQTIVQAAEALQIEVTAVMALFIGLAGTVALRTDPERQAQFEVEQRMAAQISRQAATRAYSEAARKRRKASVHIRHPAAIPTVKRPRAWESYAQRQYELGGYGVGRIKTLVMYGFNLHCGRGRPSELTWRPLAELLFQLGYEQPISPDAEVVEPDAVVCKRLNDRLRELRTRRSSPEEDDKAYWTVTKPTMDDPEQRQCARYLFSALGKIATARGGIRPFSLRGKV